MLGASSLSKGKPWLMPGSRRVDFLDDPAKQLLLLLGHFVRSLPLPFMVVTHQMKNTVDHEKDDHLYLLQSEAIGLPPGRVQRDDHVPQELRVEGNERPFSHGEGKNVGGFVTAQITPVQFLNLSIIDQGDADL